jgi:hypothetical protein
LGAFEEWRGPLRSEWDSYILTPFSESGSIRQQLTVLVEDAVVAPGLEVTPEKRSSLVGALTAFFDAWSSPSPEEYLRKIAPWRRPMAYPRDGGGGVMGAYKLVTGKTMPMGLSAESALSVFWKGRPDCPGRPSAGSFGIDQALIDFGLENTDLGPRNSRKWGHTGHPELEGKWIGPSSTAVPSLTEPLESYATVRAAHGPVVEIGWMALVVQPQGAKRCLMHIKHHWSPGRKKWYLTGIVFVENEDFITWAY